MQPHAIPLVRRHQTILDGGSLQNGPSASSDPAELLNDKQLEHEFKVKRKTWQNWRSGGRGAPYLKLGSKVLYERGAVLAWLAANRVVPRI